MSHVSRGCQQSFTQRFVELWTHHAFFRRSRFHASSSAPTSVSVKSFVTCASPHRAKKTAVLFVTTQSCMRGTVKHGVNHLTQFCVLGYADQSMKFFPKACCSCRIPIFSRSRSACGLRTVHLQREAPFSHVLVVGRRDFLSRQ